jgi:hypothetical protein
MAIPDEKTRVLVRRLTAATQRGTVKWSEVNPGVFGLSAPSASVIVQSRAADGAHPYLVSVFNQAGVSVGGGDTIPGAAYAEWEEEIEHLYSVARDSALGVDTTFEKFSRELDLPPDPGEIPF